MEAKFFKIFFLLVLALPFPAKAQRLAWTNYTTDHGLPGNEVYDMLQDRSGYLWFATERGICRFNGYEFVQPIDTSAFRGSEAFTPAEDAQGRIWFTRLDGSVWLIENDTVRSWRHNAVMAAYGKKYGPVEKMAIRADGTVCMGVFNLGLLVIRTDGVRSVLPQTNGYHFVFTETGGKLIYTSSLAKDKLGQPLTDLNMRYGVLHWKNGKAERLDSRLNFGHVHYSERGIWKLRNGELLLASRGSLSLLRNGEIVWQRTSAILPRQITQTPSGNILVAVPGGEHPGLYLFATLEHLRRNDGRNLLPSRFVTDVHCDPAGGWWATTHNAGIFYCKNPGMEIFDAATGLPSDDVTCLATDGKKTIFAGFRPTDIVAIDCTSGKIKHLPRPALVYTGVQALYFDRFRQRLWCSDRLAFFEKNRWVTTEAITKTIAPGADGVIWSSSSWGFYRTNALTGTTERFGRPDSLQNFERTFSVVEDRKGTIWVATNDGLRLWKEGKFEQPPFWHPALRFQPRQVANLFDGGLVFGLRGAGVLFRDVSRRFEHLTTRDGLSSDLVTKLIVISGDKVLVCTNKGLSYLMRFDPREDWRVEAVISTKQGLPSDQVYDATLQGGYLWVATNKGLARSREFIAPAPMPPPVLEKLLVNNQQVAIKPGLRLAHDQNNLILRFFALHFRSEGKIRYQYRLLGAKDAAFVNTEARTINFANLAPGKYTFEVQAQNEKGQWAERTSWSFEVRAAWWQTPWFWAAWVLLAAAGLRLWYLRRLHKNREEAAVRDKIRELEIAALRAQMNPHFIFNCLASIQNFIAENDVASATRYLSRFARLVRLALHGSVDGKHSLREEIEMLDSYLALEQMRFRDRFFYSIEPAPGMELDEVFLPPLLVQPFVENAIVHGMKDKSSGGGRIVVAFSLEGNTLVVIVTDNGSGYDERAKAGEDAEAGRRSVGMMLTQHRLAALAVNPNDKAFLIEPVRAEDGSVCGTQVVLRLTLG